MHECKVLLFPLNFESNFEFVYVDKYYVLTSRFVYIVYNLLLIIRNNKNNPQVDVKSMIYRIFINIDQSNENILEKNV